MYPKLNPSPPPPPPPSPPLQSWVLRWVIAYQKHKNFPLSPLHIPPHQPPPSSTASSWPGFAMEQTGSDVIFFKNLFVVQVFVQSKN